MMGQRIPRTTVPVFLSLDFIVSCVTCKVITHFAFLQDILKNFINIDLLIIIRASYCKNHGFVVALLLVLEANLLY